MKKNNHCIDCGKLIYSCSQRCYSCEGKRKYILGIIKLNKGTGKGRDSLHWKNGLPKCVDCGTELKDYRSKKCRSCNKKGNQNVKGKSWGKKRYCIVCGRRISYGSKLGRCKSCANKEKYRIGILNNKGKNNPNWQNGLGKLPYAFEFNKELKELIRKRDNYKCQYCGCYEVENCRKLDVHHIDYNKENCKKNNLITLCRKCNLKVNHNRDYWYAYFIYIINELERQKNLKEE
jgi:hypothetical protein